MPQNFPSQPCHENVPVAVTTSCTKVEDVNHDDCEYRQPAWLSDENLNASESESVDGHDGLKNKNVADSDEDEPPAKTVKESHMPAGPPGLASSLTSNALNSYAASQVLDSFKSQDDKLDNIKIALAIPPSAKNLTAKIDLLSRTLDPVNERKRQRQIQLQKHSVVCSRSNSGPTASYMGVCRLPYDENSTGTRRERRYRRIDLKSYPRSYVPFALLYFTGG